MSTNDFVSNNFFAPKMRFRLIFFEQYHFCPEKFKQKIAIKTSLPDFIRVNVPRRRSCDSNLLPNAALFAEEG
jgi:hypothetical protein